jgi:Fe-S-cluster containining protein
MTLNAALFRGRMSWKESSNGILDILISSPVARTANCHHLDRKCMRCSVHQNRPVPCRAYDCRQDKRIWSNFEERIVSPDLAKLVSSPEQPALPPEQQT